MANQEKIDLLTKHQMKVLYLKCKEGLTHAEIAEKLNREVNTVQYHMTNIYTFLEIKQPGKSKEEMDAELSAWRTARSLVGRERADEYVVEQCNGPRGECFQRLKARGPDAPYDVREQTLLVLEQHHDELIDFQRRHGYDTDLDIDQAIEGLRRG